MKITHLTSGEILALARRHHVIGVHERTWSFCRNERRGSTLLPIGGPYYLYRGQTHRHVPCFPSMYRHIARPARFLDQLSSDEAISVVADVVRTFAYYSELNPHPVFRWARAQGVDINDLEIAQHYGIRTSLLDLSESIEVALFFATHDLQAGRFEPRTTGSGVLYIVNRAMVPAPFLHRFRPVAIQPFLRPFRQWAWTCELLMGECFEACPYLAMIEFEQSAALANEALLMAERAGSLFPPDLLADLAEAVNALRVFPEHAVRSAEAHVKSAYPEPRFGSIREALRRAGYAVTQNLEPIIPKSAWSQWDGELSFHLRQWKAFAARSSEQLAVRGGGNTGRPLEWAIEGKPTDRFQSLS